jgi:two-component system, OmpR family, sensor histidine kinase TctE
MQPTPLLVQSEAVAKQEPLLGTQTVQARNDELGALGVGLRRRLLALLVLPLCVLAAINAAFDYRIAGGAALQQDTQLQRLAPLLADSLVAWRIVEEGETHDPVMVMAPPVEEFLKERSSASGYRLSDLNGRFIAGDEWIDPVVPSTPDPVLSSVQVAGVTFRIVSLKASSRVGDVVAQIADGSDSRQQWWRALVFKVLVPNLILMVAAFFVVRWAVAKALAPLMKLTHDVQNRSSSDLHPIDSMHSPLEVRPLVEALNRLFLVVDDQVKSQHRFVADAAHQLRTPLTGLQAQVEAWGQKGDALADGTITLTVDEVRKLREATRRTTKLANQLLALSRVDAQTSSTREMSVVDLPTLCVEQLHQHLDAATDKGVDLGLETCPGTVRGHEWLLSEALSNMVDNAIKYTPRGGHVTIRCGVDSGQGGLAWLEVEDTGAGIAATEKPKVLERFYRSPKATGTGNGLGLAIVHEIAKLHGARLILSDVSGHKGLRIRLQFAVRESQS